MAKIKAKIDDSYFEGDADDEGISHMFDLWAEKVKNKQRLEMERELFRMEAECRALRRALQKLDSPKKP